MSSGPPPLIAITGTGAVTAAGWGVPALLRAMETGLPLPVEDLPSPAGPGGPSLRVRRVPKPDPRPAFLTHPRLRRASPVAQFAAAAALEAMGPLPAAPPETPAQLPVPRIGLIFTLLNGCVNYTGRFFGEAERDPATASPILFPETVFNAPASHTAALLGSNGPAFTLIGDSAQFFSGVELAVQWLLDEVVDICLVVGAEESDPLTAEAVRLLAPGIILSEGAAALKLERWQPGFPAPENGTGSAPLAVISEIAGPVPVPGLTSRASRTAAARELASGLDHLPPRTLLVDDLAGCRRADAPVQAAFGGWPGPRVSPRLLLGEAPGASAAVQCVLAAHAVLSGDHSTALAAATGADQQAAALVVSAAVQGGGPA